MRNPWRPRFVLFPDLPLELRLQIWEAALPPATVHELYPVYPGSSGPDASRRTRLRSNRRRTPAMLHANRESRQVALRHLKVMRYDAPVSPMTRSADRENPASISPFYYHPARDTLFLNCVASIFLDIRWFLLDEDPRCPAPIAGWQHVALDSLHMAFVAVVAGDVFGAPKHRMQKLFPDMRTLGVVMDSKGSGKRRLRASLRPGGRTELRGLPDGTALFDETEGREEIVGYLDKDYGRRPFDEGGGGFVEGAEGGEDDDDEEETPRWSHESSATAPWKGADHNAPVPLDKPEVRFVKVHRRRFYVGVRQGLRYYYVGSCQMLKMCRRKFFRQEQEASPLMV